MGHKPYAAMIVDGRPIGDDAVRRHTDLMDMNLWQLYVFSPKPPVLSQDCIWRLSLVDSVRSYNWMMASRRLWFTLSHYRRVLVFQQDSGLLRRGIESFCELKFDYIGAPWRSDAPWAREDRRGGNGGLSLRNPRAALLTLLRHRYDPAQGSEDIFFSHKLKRVAPYDVCRAFATEAETVDAGGALPYGWHAYDKHHGPEALSALLERADRERYSDQRPGALTR